MYAKRPTCFSILYQLDQPGMGSNVQTTYPNSKIDLTNAPTALIVEWSKTIYV